MISTPVLLPGRSRRDAVALFSSSWDRNGRNRHTSARLVD